MLDFTAASDAGANLPRAFSPNPAYALDRRILRETPGRWAVITRIPKTNRDYRTAVWNEAQRLRASHFPKAAGYTVRQASTIDPYFAYVLVRWDESLVSE